MADLSTPRTDAHWMMFSEAGRVQELLDFARQLERELAAAEQRAKAAEDRLNNAEILYHYDREGPRYWWSGGTWLYPGQSIAVLDAARRKDAA